ncbi:MAG TPA: hypothetical protein DCP75_17655 [Haliea salexigens]|uniref:Uncharacterized protein n=1 Tax=Haliea salexigens TaxID=287487 RepID=A0A3C1KSG5_9GAMM|nr:hypothetical protein [Haliea salexigens]
MPEIILFRNALCPLEHFLVAVVGNRKSLTAKETPKAAQRGEPRVKWTKEHARTIFLEFLCPRPILRVINEAPKVYIEMLTQVVQEMERANFVTLVGRVRDAMA